MNPHEKHQEIGFSGSQAISVIDLSKNYFGDYFHVRLEITCEMPSASVHGSDDKAAPSPVYKRILEKMAVPSAEVENVKSLLLAEFSRNSLPYLAKPDFSEKLLARKLLQRSGAKNGYPVRSR